MYFSMDIFVNGVSFFSNSTLAWEFILWGTCMVVPNRGFRPSGKELTLFVCSRQNDIRVIPNGYEESLHMSSRTKVRDLMPYAHLVGILHSTTFRSE